MTKFSPAKALISIIEGPDEWLTNVTVVDALGLARHKGRTIMPAASPRWAILGENTRIGAVEGSGVAVQVRLFNKKAVILLAMTTPSSEAISFRHWLADRILAGSHSKGRQTNG